MRDLEQQTILVTGATDGLGKRVARELAHRDATVLLHGRSRERLQATCEEVGRGPGSEKLRCYQADFSSLGDVRELAGRILSDEDHLNVLVNNAGIISRERNESEEGYELTFAVNYLSHFLLTRLLVPLLSASSPARVVNVASAGQSPIDFEDPMLVRDYDAMKAYSQSKLAQILFTFELAERLPSTGVTVNALHPASLMDTKMVLETFRYARTNRVVASLLASKFGFGLGSGTMAMLPLLATGPFHSGDGGTGLYFDGKRETRANRQAYDETARRRLWDLSEELCGPFLRTTTDRWS
jgi:NAD(P)-dependent dehydrogenase (short-subunit alcohol dehydrogenase family)